MTIATVHNHNSSALPRSYIPEVYEGGAFDEGFPSLVEMAFTMRRTTRSCTPRSEMKVITADLLPD